MKFQLYNTAIYFKQFFSSSTIFNKEAFPDLCKTLESFPLRDDYAPIKGLYLSGDHYFRSIPFSDAEDVTEEEIRQIESITPIIDYGRMPYHLEKSMFETIIPTEGKGFQMLKSSLKDVDNYLNKLFNNSLDRKIEIHLTASTSQPLLRLVIQKGIPEFSEGKYHYDTIINKEAESGETMLPIHFDRLPAEIRRIGEVDCYLNQYSLIMIDCTNKNNKFILKKFKKYMAGMSLYSNKRDTFEVMLDNFERAKIFESELKKPESPKIPLMG